MGDNGRNAMAVGSKVRVCSGKKAGCQIAHFLEGEDLSHGNLKRDYPNKENFLCNHLKNLHANLNPLTWQAKQVATVDYSQHVS